MRKRYLLTVGLLLLVVASVTLYASQQGDVRADLIEPVLRADEIKSVNDQTIFSVSSVFLLGLALFGAGLIALIAAFI